jgi:acetoin utilization protein AcuC
MSNRVAVAWDESLIGYNFGPGHPLAPIRVELTMALAEELGLFEQPAVDRIKAEPATDDELELVHTAEYLEAVRSCGRNLNPDPLHGLGTMDNPVFPGMHEASASVCGATLAAARAVHTGEYEHALNVAGGLHHAMPAAASGFCVYNDPAVAIAWMLQNGVQRVAYVDIDVHHGDGVQQVFFDDPRVLTISLHEDGRFLFPGTGFANEKGAGACAVNVPLPPGTDDRGWLRAFTAVVPPLLEAFGHQVLVSQHGCDTHFLDPLAHLELSVDGQRTAHAALHELAHRTCDGRWLAVGGGGYELVQVVPRSWTHLLFEAAGQPLDPGRETPARWRELVRDRTREAPPGRMTDGRTGEDGRTVQFRQWRPGDDSDPVDHAIWAVRQAVFPEHGLNPNSPDGW